jgi:hypothetical protein
VVIHCFIENRQQEVAAVAAADPMHLELMNWDSTAWAR